MAKELSLHLALGDDVPWGDGYSSWDNARIYIAATSLRAREYVESVLAPLGKLDVMGMVEERGIRRYVLELSPEYVYPWVVEYAEAWRSDDYSCLRWDTNT